MAVTSSALDRAKATLYAEANIPDYWLVDAAAQAVEVYTAPAGNFYAPRRTYRPGKPLVSVALPTLNVDLAALFAG